MTTTDHYPIRHDHPGNGGDRPTPSETTFTCACGEELWERIGDRCTVDTPDEAFQLHIEDLHLDALARRLNTEGWTCRQGRHEPGQYDRCEECREVAYTLAQFLMDAELIDLEVAA